MNLRNLFRPKNSITSILVYKHQWSTKDFKDMPMTLGNYTWVFDFPEVGLYKEAFVSGADILLDRISQGQSQVLVNFSSKEFPGYKLRLDYQSGKAKEGTWYYCQELDQKLWLCPSLSKFFKSSPKSIYLDYK